MEGKKFLWAVRYATAVLILPFFSILPFFQFRPLFLLLYFEIKRFHFWVFFPSRWWHVPCGLGLSRRRFWVLGGSLEWESAMEICIILCTVHTT